MKLLEGVWDRRILSNGGPLHEQLERELARHLQVEHLSLFANGTLALLIALKALRLQGEVITTPFSFVATSEALTWNGLEPVFADIQPSPAVFFDSDKNSSDNEATGSIIFTFHPDFNSISWYSLPKALIVRKNNTENRI